MVLMYLSRKWNILFFSLLLQPLHSFLSLSPRFFHCSRFTHSLRAVVLDSMEWSPLLPQRLDVDPSVLVREGTVSTPQLAKDIDYARAVQDAWREEPTTRAKRSSESTPITYKDNEGTPLYGHVVRRMVTTTSSSTTMSVPGIVFFHTAAGPQDVCMHWKADSLVTDETTFPNGCVVLAADVLSDDIGWGWSADRTKYNAARQLLMTPDKNGVCSRLQNRIQAALETLEAIPGVDSTRLAAMGWCLGGRAVLELGRMQVPGVRSMITFHGVFDGEAPPNGESAANDNEKCQVLICNGRQDPFVSQEMLEAAVATFQRYSCNVTVLSLDGVRHGFTNPAQDYNPNPSFGFNAEAATESWSAARALLQSSLAPSADS